MFIYMLVRMIIFFFLRIRLPPSLTSTTTLFADAPLFVSWVIGVFVVDDADRESRALEIASKIAARPPIHVAMAKQLIDGVHGDQIRRGIREELVAISALYKTEDRQEARAARNEKRDPVFKGL